MIAAFRRLLTRAEPVIADAVPRDAAAIAKLHARSFKRGWSEDEIDALLLDRAVLTQRAVVGRELVAFIMSRIAGDEAEVLSVAVSPACRGRGLSRTLLSHHMRRLAGAGVTAIFLEVGEQNTPATRLYRRAGFVEVGRRANYYGDSANALVLRRDLV